jgi:cystathionine gamma-synthase
MKHLSTASWLVSAGRPAEPGSPLNVPPVPASSYLAGGDRHYSREDGTLAQTALEDIIGGMEGGRSLAFSSGMAAAAAVFDTLHAGARVVIPEACYQGVAGLAEAGLEKGRWQLQRMAADDTTAWSDAAKTADLLWLESPTNPLLTVMDLEAICAAPRRPGSLCVVDNTFATPLNQQPLRLGADVSMQSATKFIGGHSDLLAGILTVRDTELLRKLSRIRTLGGAAPGALETWLAVRGLRTMALRVERAQDNAGQLATFLAAHPAVETVRYPGLASHSTHRVAAAQLKGFGTVISFDVKGGAEAADAVCTRLKLIRHATSLGGVESTIERRGKNPGQDYLPPSLLRLSVGIESFKDLRSDLEQALA